MKLECLEKRTVPSFIQNFQLNRRDRKLMKKDYFPFKTVYNRH